MKRRIAAGAGRWAAAGMLMLSAGCSRGFLYRNSPALEFNDLSYSHPTKLSSGSPRLAYIDAGTGGETIVLIHGLATNAGYFRYNIAELARSHRVIAVDLPGYGKSEKRASFPYTMSFYAASVAGLLRELNVQRVVAGGHSMGGQIAMLLALQEPQLVSALVLLDPAGIEAFGAGEGEWLRNTLTIQGITDVPEDGIRRNLSMNFLDWRPEWEWMVEERTRLARSAEFPQFANAVVKSVGAMLDEPTSDLLSGITQPALIVYGVQDGLIPNPYLHPGRSSSVFQPGATRFRDARVVAVQRAGHMVQIEQAAAVNRAILEFLGRRD
jgi:pimeloyl-ACP methyl ester carboxylesterase